MTSSLAIEAYTLSGISAGFGRYLSSLVPQMLHLLAEQGADQGVTMLCRPGRQHYRRLFPEIERLAWQPWYRDLWPLRRPYSAILCPTHRIPEWRLPVAAVVYDFYDEHGVGFHDPRDARRAIELRSRLITRADRLLCISHATQADLLHFHPEAAGKSCVVPLGVGEMFARVDAERLAGLRAKLQLHRPYLLYIGANRRNKNIARLILAFAQAPERREFELVIAGPMLGADGDPEVARMLAQPPAGTTIRQIGYVEDSDLPALYAGAQAFLFPSLKEGFGLPILEAMKCGTPVLTSLGSSCEEVAGGHAVLVDPQAIDSIIDGIGRVVRCPTAQLSAAHRHAESYSWRSTAAQTLDEMRRMADAST